LQLTEGDNFETPNTFYIQGKLKSLELHTKLVNFTCSSLWCKFLVETKFAC